jgi:cysteine-rich secretory family protein
LTLAAKRLLPALLCAAAVLAPGAPAFGITTAERQMVELPNRYRASWGLSRLRLSPHLLSAAEWFAADKAQTGSFDQSHYDSLGRFPDERFADFDYPPGDGWTENLAAGSESPFEVLEAWRQSPAHDANLRRRDARVIGVGLATNPETGIAVWVADYAVHIGSARDPSTGSARASAAVRASGCPRVGDRVRCSPGRVVTLSARSSSTHAYLVVERRQGGRWREDASRPRVARVRVRNGFQARVRVLAPSLHGRTAGAPHWLTVTAR